MKNVLHAVMALLIAAASVAGEAPKAADAAAKAESQVCSERADEAALQFQLGNERAIDECRIGPITERDVPALCRQLQRGNVGARMRAATQLGRFGKSGADCLVYAVRHDANLEVRERVAVALGNLGAAAGREACVQLQWIAGAPNPWLGRLTIKSTPEEMMDSVRYDDLRRAARNAVRKIGC